MAGKNINSVNIVSFDSKVLLDLCSGNLVVDVTPSVFLNPTAPLGVKVKIIDPYDTEIKSYGSTYDIVAPYTSAYSLAIPVHGSDYLFGVYKFVAQITDADGAVYETDVKAQKICSFAESCGCIEVEANCLAGTLDVYSAEPPVYQGKMAFEKTESFKVVYPANTIADDVFSTGRFSVQLFQGHYSITGNVCASYNIGDNVFVKASYTVTAKKNALCSIDWNCIAPKLKKLHEDIYNNRCASELDTQVYTEVLINLEYYKQIISFGYDPTGVIKIISDLLGGDCITSCDDSAPVINNTPTNNFVLEGCGVTRTPNGLTITYRVDNYSYKVGVNIGQNVLTLGSIDTNGCEKTINLNFNLSELYNAVKSQLNLTQDYDYWLNDVVFKGLTLRGLDGACLGYNATTIQGIKLVTYLKALEAKACAGGACIGTVSNVTVSKVGGNSLFSFAASNCQFVKIYIDGVFVTDLIASLGSYLAVGYANGIPHNYSVIPICSNGNIGTVVNGTFTHSACASIAPPSVSLTNITGASCPYNLNGLVTSLPPGIVSEWHTTSSPNPATLVPNPSAVTDGVYYVFAKDISGCYSLPVLVQLTCAAGGGGGGTVTAPQNITSSAAVGGQRIAFQSAAYPPPANSYTLSRRVFSDPDIPASYTTIGSTNSGINFNASTNLYEVLDTTAVLNTRYVYKCVSNGGNNPFSLLDYANISCANLEVTPTINSLPFSFTPGGGQIDKYVVELYDTTGLTLINSVTRNAPFSNPVTGSFTGLPGGVSYRIRLSAFIGTYRKDCAFSNTQTVAADPATSVLTFLSYTGGEFTFVLSNPIPSTDVVVTTVDVNGYASANCTGGSIETDGIPGTNNAGGQVRIIAGSTIGTFSSASPFTSSQTYKKANTIVVNGISKNSGSTITIGGTVVTVQINTSCTQYEL